MDYEGYTFVFFYQNINKIFSLKCDTVKLACTDIDSALPLMSLHRGCR